MKVKNTLGGSTIKLTWISSGTTADSIGYAVYNGSESVVDSGTLTSSGNGHYYANHQTPNTPGYYAVEFTAHVGANPYKNRTAYRVILEDVD